MNACTRCGGHDQVIDGLCLPCELTRAILTKLGRGETLLPPYSRHGEPKSFLWPAGREPIIRAMRECAAWN